MKFITNFARPSGRVLPYLSVALVLLSMVAVVVAITLAVSARQNSTEIPLLEDRLARYQSREIQKSRDLLPYDKLEDLLARIKGVNDLASKSGQTLPLLFSRLEEIIPEGVWLITLQFSSHENETKLVAEASQADLLTDFMGKLERSGFFSQVLLTRQTQRSEGTQGAIQFEIQLRGKS
jgi:Tfp pilus assembly protein PilN